MKPSLIIVGLGNPGLSYARTRHNAGFQAIDALSAEFAEGEWNEKQKFHALIQEARIVTIPILLVKPLLYMNRSGEAIAKIVDFYKIDPKQQLLVLCDDIDIPLGETRLRLQGGPGTHNGLRSIAQIYGESYPRLRIGIGPQSPGEDLANWVLSVPPPDQETLLRDTLIKVPALLREYVLPGKTSQEA